MITFDNLLWMMISMCMGIALTIMVIGKGEE